MKNYRKMFCYHCRKTTQWERLRCSDRFWFIPMKYEWRCQECGDVEEYMN